MSVLVLPSPSSPSCSSPIPPFSTFASSALAAPLNLSAGKRAQLRRSQSRCLSPLPASPLSPRPSVSEAAEMSSLQRHRNRPRSMTVESLSPTYDVQLVGAKKMTVHSKTNFRPVAYQTKEELDRFFGTTPSQKREQRLRVRESDGRIYYDTIEKEEWRELLAPLTPRCGTPNNLTARRRSSNMTAWSSTGGEGSPLSLASPSHNVMPDEEGGSRRGSYAWSMSPISSRFGSVTVNSSVAGQDTDLIDMEETHDSMPRRARRKRSNSALARSANYVDEGPLRPAIGSSDPDGWQSMPAFKRRLSEQVTGSPDLIEDDATVSEQERIRISRLPLARRKLGSLDMDLAFSPEITNGNAASTTSLASRRLDRPHVPAALQPASKTRPQSMHAACMPLTSSSTSSRAAPMSPLSPSSFGHRRTNGVCKIEGGESSHDTVLVPLRGCAATLSLASPAPSSAATLEVLNSPVCQPGYPLTPTFAPGSNREQGSHQTSRLRHASSMDFSSSNSAVRQSLHMPQAPTLRPVKSYTSLRSTAGSFDSSTAVDPFSLPSAVADKGSDGEGKEAFTTALAPRRGAKKYDIQRRALLSTVSSDSSRASTTSGSDGNTEIKQIKDPYSSDSAKTCSSSPSCKGQTVAETGAGVQRRGVGGLRTGPEVYEGVEIPCASIHLHSDEEDNVHPSLAYERPATRRRRKTKPRNHNHQASFDGFESTDSNSSVAAAGGLSRWWSSFVKS